MLKFLKLIVLVVAFAAFLSPVANADVTRTGNTFSLAPQACSCMMVYGGYTFVGMPPNLTVRSMFKMPTNTPVASDLIDLVSRDPDFGKVIQEVQTSVSATTTVTGTVDDSGDGG